jgi:hypothetical protein
VRKQKKILWLNFSKKKNLVELSAKAKEMLNYVVNEMNNKVP